jgi:asparagine synthase (glutamine-hydrolysing)
MSRIVGLFSELPEVRATSLLDSMLGHFSRVGVEVQKCTAGRCVMGAASFYGSQKVVAQRGGHAVIIDGCIFEAKGIDVLGRASVDVVLDLFERYGFQNALSRINGDFAIALYDSTKNTLWLGRDRVGVRPMYYTVGQGFFAFSSQPGALLRLPNVPRDLNRRFVGLFAGSHYRTFDNANEESPFAAISQLPAAHIAEICFGKSPRITSYWSLNDEPDFNLSERRLAAAYKELLLDSVRIRLRQADSPAFLLSGGMDSSSVLASAVFLRGSKQHAFSSVYEDRTYDESEEISAMLDSNVEEWHAVEIKPLDLFSIIDKMVRVHDEPVATATWLSHFLVSKQAKNSGFKTIFGGLGGDELNAGEYEHFFYHFADLRFSGKEDVLANEVEHWVRHHDHPVFRKSKDVVEDALKRVVDLNNPGRCLPDRHRIDRYADAVNPEYFDIRRYVPVMDTPFRSYLKNRTYQDIFRETAPCCLRAEDRQSNAFGLQHYDPFFDYRLIEFMFRVPGALKIRDGVTKVLLREATKGLLPEATRTRIKKTGWNAPTNLWFSEKTLSMMKEILCPSRGSGNLLSEVYDPVFIESLIQEQRLAKNQGGVGSHEMFFWQALNLAIWHSGISVSTSGNYRDSATL